jgi:hypothetical protein
METNTEFTYFFEDVVELLGQNGNKLLKVKKLIEDTELVKKPTKKVLLGRIDNIFAESNAIVQKLGALGKVK